MAHSIKVTRARKMAPAWPMAEAEIWRSISPALVDRLTAAELAEVVRCLDAHWHRAEAHALAAAAEEGALWDARSGRLRELCPHSTIGTPGPAPSLCRLAPAPVGSQARTAN